LRTTVRFGSDGPDDHVEQNAHRPQSFGSVPNRQAECGGQFPHRESLTENIRNG